jgi:ATP-dependent Zn protease
MAGKKAEELVFGKDHQISFGCKQDIQTATRIFLDAVRSGVLPGLDVYFESPVHGSGRHLPETTNEIDFVKAELEKASQQAENILKENLGIYQSFIKILLDKKTVTEAELTAELIQAGVNLHQLFETYPKPIDYRAKLKSFLYPDSNTFSFVQS